MKPIKLFLLGAGIVLALHGWTVLESSSAYAMECSKYELTGASHYIVGCYDPCMCPISVNFTLQGTFLLAAVDPAGDGSLFEVKEIDWHFIQGDQTILVTGSGWYEIDANQHRLTLDLLVGNEPVQHFDSGLVPLPSEVAGISISVAVNGFYCFDQVFVINAVPAPVGLSSSTWGSLKSTFR